MNIKNKIKIMLSASVGLVFFGLAFLTNFVSAQAQTKVNQTNAQIPISAYVLNRDKTALANGDYDVRFAIYTTDRQNFDPYPSNSDKASQVWSETQKISITNGLISTYLGSTTPLPVSLTFSNGDYYLGVMIGNDGEMAPRKKIGSVPAAINSVYLQGKTIGNQAGDIPMLGAGGQIDVAMLPTGTGTGQLITGSDSRLHNQNTDTGTDQTIFNVGSGTSVGSTNFDLAVSNDSAKPTLRFDATERVWKLSNNGSVFDQVLTTASQFSTDKLVSGILPVGRGGLGLASFNPGDLLFASAQNALAALPIGTEGYCLKVRDNVPYWELCTTGSQHNLLSSMHPDTEASSVQRGDLIVGQGSTPLWRRLPIGDTGKVLRSDGIDVNWQTLTKADLGLSNVENVALSTWGSLGTITTGVWQGSNISTHYGGTGLDGSGAGFGALLIGNGSGYTLATLTPGLGISIANTSGAISIASTLGTSVDLASEVEGILPVVNGGTGTSTLTTNGVLFGNGTSAVAASAAGTSGQLLLANASGLPFFATLGGDATLAATGAITIGTGAIDSLKIADNTIKENNLSVTNDPTAGYILTYDSLGRFTWISNTGGSGASKWTDTGAYTYLSKTTNGLALGSSSAIDAPLFFDAASNSIIFQGATIDEYRTTFTLVDPTANRTLTLPNVSGELSALGQTIETGEITNGTILGADLNFTGVTGAPRDGEVIVYDNATGGFGSVAIGSGGIGDITSIGDVISNDAFTATSTQGSSLWFYDSHGRGQLTLAPLSNPRTYTLPDASGTIITTGNFPDITQLATITNGTWHGAAIGAAYGGTGLNTSALTGVATVALGAWNITSTLAANLGGTGLDTHALSGVPTISSGTWSISPTLSVAHGGTGLDGTVAGFGALLIGNGSGYTLGTLMAGQGIAINNDSAMITISSTLGTTVDLTSAVVGLLPIASGGTGAGVFTPHGVLLGNGTSAITATAPISAGQLLVSNGTLTPAFVSLSGDASITAAGVFSIGASAITGNKIASATIKSGNLAATNGPSAGYILSYDPISTGFVWISNTGGAGASKWTDAGSYTYLNSITSDMALGGNSTTDSAFFFDVSTGDITLQGATIDQNKTTLHTTDPTANRAITFPDASGEVSLLGQSIDSSEITNGTILPVDLSTSNAGAEGQVLIYNSASSNFAWSSAGSGGIGDITSVGNALTGDAFSATGAAGTSLWFYDPQGRGQLTINDLTAARTYFLPDASGTVITSGNLSDIVRTGTIANGTWNGAVIDPIYGGTGSPTRFTKGSVVFAGNSGAYNQSNTNFFWDDANSRLGLGTIVPAGRLDVRGAGTGTGIAFQTQSATGTLGIVALDNGNIGLGTTSAAQQLSLTGSLAMVDTTTATTGVIYKGVNRFIHNFAASGTSGSNFFAGTSAGNFTMSGTGTQASFNTGLGVTTLSALTNGAYNSAVGAGASAGNTTGNYNSTFGSNALFANTIGSNNVAFGYQAGQFQADGVTAMTDPENSIYLGAGSRGATNSDPNSIVIGYGAVGLGANTTVIGNASTTLTKLFGNLNLTASSYLNWGATAGAGGYGMRDNGGIIEYRNSTGAWTSISAGAGGMAIGGNIASVTAGSVLYANASGNMAQDNSNFFYDGTNSRLGLGNTSPQYLLDVSKSTNDYLARIYNLNPGSSAGGLSIRTDGTGNLLNLNANGSDIVTISEAASTFNNPTSFMAVGDVSMAYDLTFTNATSATIHSAGPVAISAGETFGSSYLTLQTFNAGKIVLDAAGGVALNQAQAWMLAAGTSALNLTNSAGTTLLNVDSTNGRIGIGNATPGGTLSIVSANATGITTGAALNLSANSLTTGTGFYGASSTLTTGDLMDLQVSGTAAGASQTALNILTTGANATAAISTYGAQISNTHTGSGTNVGLYLNASGGTNNYGLIVAAGNVGIGTTSPSNLLSVGYNVANSIPLVNIGYNPTSGNVATTNGYLSLLNVVTADPIAGISTGALLGFNSAPTNFFGQGIGALRNSKYDIWFQTGAANGGGYRFYTGTSEKVTIDYQGNVGIGTTAPAGLLQVTQPTTGPGTVSNTAGGTTLTGVGTQFTNTFKVGDTVTVGGQTVAISAIGSDTSMTVAAITNANTSVAYTLTGGSRLAVLGNGNVGIGTTSPGAALQVNGTTVIGNTVADTYGKLQVSSSQNGYVFAAYDAAANNSLFFVGDNKLSAYTDGIIFGTVKDGGTQVAGPSSGNYLWSGGQKLIFDDYSKAGIGFYQGSVGTTGAYSMYINTNGNVGIGTSTPYGKLSVSGAPTASVNYGTLSIGGGAFDGSTAGKFAGSANGTSIAVDEVSGYTGNLMDLQVGGASKFNVDNAGRFYSASYAQALYFKGVVDLPGYMAIYSPLSGATAGNGALIQIGNINIRTNVSGAQQAVAILPNYNQTSGTASNTDLLINRTQTAVGSGAQLLIDAQVGSASKFNVTNTGQGYFAGNVGVGTTSPATKLEVNGSVRFLGTANATPVDGEFVYNTTLHSYTYYDSSSSSWKTLAGGTVNVTGGYWTQNGTDLYYASGNVGVGTTAPQHKLDVAGNLGLAASAYLNFGATDGATGYGLRDNAGTVEFKNSTGAWAAVGGILGVGNSITSATAGSVFFAGTAGVLAQDNTNFNYDSTGHTFKLGYDSTHYGTLSVSSAGVLTTTGTAGQTVVGGTGVADLLTLKGTSNAGATATSPAIQMNVGNNGATNAMTILNNGNVGIGTTSPTQSLDVNGNITIPSNKAIYLSTPGTANSIGYAGWFQGGAQPLTFSHTRALNDGSSYINFLTNSAEVMRITYGGSVGIGTTTPYGKLNVYGAPTASANYGTLSIGGGAFDGTTAGKFVGNASGTSIAVDEATGYGGNLIDLQVAGSSNFNVSSSGGGYFRNNTTVNGFLAASLFSNSSNATHIGNIGNTPADSVSRITVQIGGVGYASNYSDLSTGGTQTFFKVAPVYNQASSTASNTDLLINRTQTAVGSGAQSLANLQVGGTSWYSFATGNTATTGGFNAASGTENAVTIAPIINQSGTAGWTGLLVNPTLTAVGSGSQVSAAFMGGKVGIGTTGPATKLDVRGAINTSVITLGADLASGGYYLDLAFSAGSGGSDGTVRYIADTYAAGGRSFVIRPAGTEAMRIRNDGSVGIGTTTPYGKLNVYGAPTASANYGTLSIGGGAFDGTTAGKFVGNASGTSIAVDEATGYGGNLIDLQVAGIDKFKVNYQGSLTVTDIYSQSTGNWSINNGGQFHSVFGGFDSSVSPGTNGVFAWVGTVTNTGSQIGLKLAPTYNQASGTASNTDLLINRTQTAVGSGAQLLIDAQVGGASKFSVTNTGQGYFAGNLGLASSAYLNFGATDGTAGYGLRDNAGVVEYKNSAGTWTSILSSSGGVTIGGNVTGGTVGSILFAGASNVVAQDNANFFYDQSNHRLGLGTTSPAQQLSLTNSLGLVDTTTATTGVIFKGTNRFMHNYQATGTTGANFFAGVNAGNFTLSGTGTQASNNTGVGQNALAALTTGSNDSALGSNALVSVNTGSNNVALGDNAGRYFADGSTALTDPENSIYLGAGAMGKDNSDANSIVIGYGAIGLGANTTVLGNSSTVLTRLFGSVGIGTSAPATTLDVAGSVRFLGSANSTPVDGELVFDPALHAYKYYSAFASAWQTLAGGTINISGGFWNQRGTDLSYVTGNVGIGTTLPTTALDVSGVITATGGNSSNWNQAYAWGNHALAGYLTSGTVFTLSGDVSGTGTGGVISTSIASGSVTSAKIADGTIKKVDLAGTNNLTAAAGNLLSYDAVSGGFTWINNDGGTGATKWTDSGVGYSYLTNTANDLILGSTTPADAQFVFHMATGNITMEGSTANGYETTLALTDPTAVRTITIPDATGTMLTTGNLSAITGAGTISTGVWNAGAVITSAAVQGSTLSATSLAQGSIVFAGASGLLSQNNAGLFWDNASSYLGIGTTSPAAMLQVGSLTNPGNVRIDKGWLCVDSDGTCTGAGTAGTIYATNAFTQGADYAEYFATKDTNLQAGEAVCLDPTQENSVKRCQNNGDNNLMGIVSSNPSIVGNKKHANDGNYVIIGMLGQVAGKVSNENGDLKVGDSLTAAATPGQLRKANAGESTVGVALENFSNNTGTIQILISRRNQSLTVEKVQQQVTDNIASMNIKDQVDNLVAQASNNLDKQLASSASELANLQTQLADQVIITNKLQAQIDDLKKLNQTLTDFIAVLDPAKLIYKDSLGNLDLLDGKLSASGIETGVLTIKVVDKESPTIGQAAITKVTTDENNDGVDDKTLSDGKSVQIKTKAANETAKIYVTPVGSTKNQVLYVGKITPAEGFAVNVDSPVGDDINFNWWIVQEGK